MIYLIYFFYFAPSHCQSLLVTTTSSIQHCGNFIMCSPAVAMSHVDAAVLNKSFKTQSKTESSFPINISRAVTHAIKILLNKKEIENKRDQAWWRVNDLMTSCNTLKADYVLPCRYESESECLYCQYTEASNFFGVRVVDPLVGLLPGCYRTKHTHDLVASRKLKIHRYWIIFKYI